jgi:hypothetical protein
MASFYDIYSTINYTIKDNNFMKCYEVRNIKEIKNYKNIIELNCYLTDLTSYNFNFPKLKKFYCCYSKIKNLIMTNKTLNSLQELGCQKTSIEDLPEIPNLKILICSDTNISNLLSYPKLEILDCCKTKINKINNELKCLEELYCSNTLILYIENLPNLKLLDCCNSKIIYLNNLPKLEELHCSENVLFSKNLYVKNPNNKYYEIFVRCQKKIKNKYKK